MTRVPTLARSASGLFTALFIAALIAVTAGCGSDGNPDTPPPSAANPPPPPEPIEGVATPSSVALVTATNAQ